MATQQKAGEDILASDIIDPTLVYKNATETVNNNATLQNDDELFVTLGVGLWRVEALIAQISVSATPDLKTNWTFSGTVGNNTKNCMGPTSANTVATATTPDLQNHALTTSHTYGSTTNSSFIKEEVYVEVTVAGTLQFQWAQGTATASDTQVQSASRLYVTQVFI